jgi:hypothetical protein
MKIKLLFLCTFCFTTSALFGSNTNGLTCEDVIQGLISHSKSDTYPELMNRQKWMNDIKVKQAMLTNETERGKLAKELIQILNSEKSNHEDKCAAAYLLGLFRLKEGVKALVENFSLRSKAALEPDLIPAEREKPAQHALIKIGEPSVSEVMTLIELTTNAYIRGCGAQVILFIKGQEDGAAFLKQAIVDQTDGKKRDNLKAAISSEYFTDPKYRASGPQK